VLDRFHVLDVALGLEVLEGVLEDRFMELGSALQGPAPYSVGAGFVD
jgi:hypothetical protein